MVSVVKVSEGDSDQPVIGFGHSFDLGILKAQELRGFVVFTRGH